MFQAPPLDADRKAMQLLLVYWDPASPLTAAEALHRSAQHVAELLPAHARLPIVGHLGQHIDGDIQNLLLGDMAALKPGRLYEGWVHTVVEAMATEEGARIAARLLQVVGAFNAAIWRLRRAHGVA